MTKNLVIFDSAYGNTQKIAEAIASALNTKAFSTKDINQQQIHDADLIIFGSPTQGGRPTKQMQEFIDNLGSNVLAGKRVAAFDTRFFPKEHGRALRFLMKVISFAAPRIAKSLTDKGASLTTEPEGFFVHDTEGPLNDGEIERAQAWAEQLAS